MKLEYTPENELVALEIEHAREVVNLRTLTVNGHAVPVNVLTSARKASRSVAPKSASRRPRRG